MAFDFNTMTNTATVKKPAKTGGFDFASFGGETEQKPVPKKKGFLGTIVDVGRGAAKGAGSTTIGLGQLALKAYTLLPGEQRLAQDAIETGEDIKKQMFTPENTAEKIGYGAEQIGEFFIPAGIATKGVKAVNAFTKASKLGNVAKTAINLGGKAGIGAVEAGGVRAAQTGGDAEETAKAAAFGAAVPFVAAGASKAFKGAKNVVSNIRAGRAEKAIEEAAILKSGAADARVATKVLDEAGAVVKDPRGLEAVKQGIPERDVANIKFGTVADKAKMRKMLDIAESASTNKRIVERSTDVVGDTFLNQAKFIATKNKEAAQTLNVIATKLKGKSVNITDPITSFLGEMEASGIRLGAKGKLKFKGSEFEGIKSAENAINNLWQRIQRFKGGRADALEAHRLKRYIDNVVEYGKSAEGLVGKAQSVLKGFRRNIDGVLDTQFPAYNKANTIFSETIEQLHQVNQVMGRRMKIGDQFANVKAGTAMRGLFSNIKSRGELMQLLDGLQKVGKKYGMKVDEDIVTQANFADTIENVFGSEAATSFMGQIEKGLGRAQEVANVANDLSRGNILGAGFRAGKSIVEHAKGISQANKVKALRELLGEVQKNASVFGKK